MKKAIIYFWNGGEGSGGNIGKTMCVVEKLIVEFW